MNEILPIIFAYSILGFYYRHAFGICFGNLFTCRASTGNTRIELFRLRDELRSLSIQTDKRLDPEIFRLRMQSGMNSLLKIIPFLDIRFIKSSVESHSQRR